MRWLPTVTRLDRRKASIGSCVEGRGSTSPNPSSFSAVHTAVGLVLPNGAQRLAFAAFERLLRGRQITGLPYHTSESRCLAECKAILLVGSAVSQCDPTLAVRL